MDKFIERMFLGVIIVCALGLSMLCAYHFIVSNHDSILITTGILFFVAFVWGITLFKSVK
jgi:hypothetical protein